MSTDGSPNYDGLMTVHELINHLYDTGDVNAKVFLGVLTPDGNNARTKCSIQAVHGDAWKLPAVEIVGQPLDGAEPAHDEAACRTPGQRNLLTILSGLTEGMDEQEGGETHINGHTVRFVRATARAHYRQTETPEVDETTAPGTVKPDPDNCKCPRCAPRQWLVPDLIEQINQRDDALGELVMSAELAVLYRDDRAFGRLREALAGWREASEDPR